MCGSMADIQSPTAEIRRGKKRKKKEQDTDKNIIIETINTLFSVICVVTAVVLFSTVAFETFHKVL